MKVVANSNHASDNNMLILVLGIVMSFLSAGCVGSSAANLTVGDCFEVPDEGEFSRVNSLDCDTEHTAQLYAEFESEDDDYSSIDGNLGVDQTSGIVISGFELECNNLLVDIVENGIDLPEDFEIFLIYPTEDEWESGERKIQCVITSESGMNSTLI